MDLEIFEKDQCNKKDQCNNSLELNLSSKTDVELEKMQKNIPQTWIYELNVKGDALYDFTCQSNHRCPKCDSSWYKILNQNTRSAEQKAIIQNLKTDDKRKKSIRQQYFSGQLGCECKKDQCVSHATCHEKFNKQ